MAEPEQSIKNTRAPPRRSYHQNRPSSSYRGRGRANASVNKALHLFGVRDLREILDRKHQEQDETSSGVPPDPSYNYLRDPSRENINEHQNHKYQKEQHPERTSSDQHQKSYHFRGSRGRGRGAPRENRHSDLEKFLQNPVNIKVELVSSTGERNCKLDEDTKLKDIKHVPNYKLKDLRTPRNENRDTNDRSRNERGRGRGQRGERGRGMGGRGRGRGARGRGRGQNRYPSNRSENVQEGGCLRVQNTPEVDSEENWDTPLDDPPAENVESNKQETVDEGSHDGDPEDQELEHEEQYYDEGDVEDYEEASENTVILEENLIITSSADEDKNKRTVTFKLDDEPEGPETQKSENKEIVEPLKKENIEKVEASKDEK